MKQLSELPRIQEIQVSYKRNYSKENINSSSQAFETCKQVFSLAEANISLKEYFFILLLNRSNKVIGFYKLSEGGLSGTVADLRLAFSVALKTLASAMIIMHNHPSGNVKPSDCDLKLTRKFKQAGEILDIKVLDSLVIAEDEFLSFADEGLM